VSYFKVKMHKVRFLLWLYTPNSTGKAYSAPPDLLAGFQGPTSNRKRIRGKEADRKRKRERGGSEIYHTGIYFFTLRDLTAIASQTTKIPRLFQ